MKYVPKEIIQKLGVYYKAYKKGALPIYFAPFSYIKILI
jgi:hypothetical protein